MPQKSKKYKITTRTREMFVLRRRRQRADSGICPVCRRSSDFQTLNSATIALKRGKLEILRLIAEQVVHAFEADDGELLICDGSLGI
ncbi:MAG: hypothetical protein IPN69_01090 [Acidobacteria bacterium]|nr:hypothetical protein [Acidobacteriota bacterium]